jgi:hypothetical protein
MQFKKCVAVGLECVANSAAIPAIADADSGRMKGSNIRKSNTEKMRKS